MVFSVNVRILGRLVWECFTPDRREVISRERMQGYDIHRFHFLECSKNSDRQKHFKISAYFRMRYNDVEGEKSTAKCTFPIVRGRRITIGSDNGANTGSQTALYVLAGWRFHNYRDSSYHHHGTSDSKKSRNGGTHLIGWHNELQ